MLGGNRRVSRRTARRVSRRRGMMDSGSMGYSQEPSETDELSKLAELRDEGVITEEEFESKKRQILGI